MANLSQSKRKEMLDFLDKIRAEHQDDETLKAINEIENTLTEKKYGLVWEEHTERVDEEMVHNIPIFTEIEDRKIKNSDSNDYNFLIEGDNLHSLKLLEKTHKGKIDIIYIDPPYNTGNEDFKYNDIFVDKTDGYSHSKWLSFMSERLYIARQLLSEKGFIFISIDDNEYPQLKLLCDEIFYEDNYEKTDYLQVRYLDKTLKSDMKYHKQIEQVLVYKKSSKAQPYLKPIDYEYDKYIYYFEELERGKEIILGNKKVEIFQPHQYRQVKATEGNKKYLKEIWATGTILNGNSSGRFFRDFLADRKEIDGLGILYKVYDIGDDSYDYRYFTGPKKANATKGKYFQGVPVEKLNDGAEITKPIPNFYDMSGDFGNIRHEGKVAFNSGKKPIKLIKQYLEYFKEKDITILDFFAGSGTTGHAVMQLNKEDGGNRKYILCTNNENNICEEITYQRLQNIQNELPHNLKYFKTGFIPKFSENEESSIKYKMLNHVKELIELEYMCEIDGINNILVRDEEEFDEIVNENMKENIRLFVSSDIFASKEQQLILEQKNIEKIEIPEYYYRSELREVGEL